MNGLPFWHFFHGCEGQNFYLFAPARAPLGIRKKEREGRKERKEEREKLGNKLIWYNSVISMVMHFFSLSCLVFI
jgi:hypothetical protein